MLLKNTEWINSHLWRTKLSIVQWAPHSCFSWYCCPEADVFGWFYEHINKLADRFYTGFSEAFQRLKIKGMAKGIGGMFGVYLGLNEEPTNYGVIAAKYH